MNTITENLMNTKPTQTRERLVYEPLRQTHAFDLAPALTDPRVYEFIEGPYPTTVEQLAVQFAGFEAGPLADKGHERWWDYAVRLGQGGQAVGRLETTLIDDWAEIAYLFGRTIGDRGTRRKP